jgi:hypothetical protein
MAIDTSDLAFPKGKPRKQVKAARDAKATTAMRKAYRTVDTRDKKLSWVSGAALDAKAAHPDFRLVHHHMERRSQSKARRADDTNILTVSATEAIQLDTHALKPVNADGEEVFDVRQIVRFAWNREMVRSEDEEPFDLPERAFWPERVTHV